MYKEKKKKGKERKTMPNKSEKFNDLIAHRIYDGFWQLQQQELPIQ